MDPVRQRVLQVHPTLRCNLRCAHCYSASGPWLEGALRTDDVRAVLDDAAELGYQTLAVSGGEPLLYAGLPDVLRHARQLGLRTSVTSNGTLLEPRRLEPVLPYLDLLAVSVDGPPELHNRIRGATWAFDRTQRGLDYVRQLGLTFGVIHTLTPTSWEHLVWLAEFAYTLGATLLQIHPVEQTGRARELMHADDVHADVLARAFLLVHTLRQDFAGKMHVQFDVLPREQVLRQPALIYAGAQADPSACAADLLGVLVLEADGTLSPISYGFGRGYAIGRVPEARLADAWRDFTARGGYSAFRGVCAAVWRDIAADESRTLVNWHELIVAASQSAATATG